MDNVPHRHRAKFFGHVPGQFCSLQIGKQQRLGIYNGNKCRSCVNQRAKVSFIAKVCVPLSLEPRGFTILLLYNLPDEQSHDKHEDGESKRRQGEDAHR